MNVFTLSLWEIFLWGLIYFDLFIYIFKQAFNEFLDFGTVHSLMKDINLIDSCQAHLPMQYPSNIKFIARSDTGVLIDSEPHPSCACKSIRLVVCVHAGCSAFLFYTPTKPLIQLHIKYKTVFFS